jgi:hypothetical protein
VRPGPRGTNEVLAALEVGEGVIDADTMRRGADRSGNVYEFTITNWEDGSGHFRKVISATDRQHDLVRRAGVVPT